MSRSPRFPYMFWAHEESFVSSFGLAQSGLAAREDAWLTDDLRIDLHHPCAAAQPAFEAHLAERFGVEPERVITTLGGSGAMAVAAAQLFGPRTRVVTETPSYEPFRVLPEVHGAQVVTVDRFPEEDWRLDVDAVVAALGAASDAAHPTDRSHAFLCLPHNPTGTPCPAEDVRAIADACAARGGVLVSNEVYAEFALPGERVHAPLLAPNTLSIGSLTKAYGLGALRIGWIVLGEGLVDARPAFLDQAYLGWVDPPTPSLQVALRALAHPDRLRAPLEELAHTSRPIFEAWLRDCPEVEGRLGPYGLTAFPRVVGVEDTRALQLALAAEQDVDVVPGEYFARPGHLRIGWGLPTHVLEEGLRRLEQGIRAYRDGGGT